MKQKRVFASIGIIILLGASFWGGILYQKAHAASAFGQFRTAGAAGLGGRFGAAGTGATVGTILSSDSGSITVQMQDGSTKIIFVTNSTPIMKTLRGTLTDLSVGTPVSITGSANADGSITAQAIQIRSATSSLMR